MPAGRTGKYAEWLTEDGLLCVEGWAREGMKEEDIARKMGISYTTFREWKKKFPTFTAAIKKGKAPVDFKVENSLLKRALGYEYEEEVIEVFRDGSEHTKKIKKHMPADVTAMIFWLKNRCPDRWRDRPAADQTEKYEDDGLVKALTSNAKDLFADGDDSGRLPKDDDNEKS